MSDIEERASKKPRFERVKGVAPIKPEFLLSQTVTVEVPEDDDAESAGMDRVKEQNGGGRKDKKSRGQNKNRKLAQKKELVKYCERERLEDGKCSFGDKCRMEHDLEKYLASKLPDLDGTCPVYDALGYCPAGVKCRWLKSHFVDGKLLEDPKKDDVSKQNYEVNVVGPEMQRSLQRREYKFKLSDAAINAIENEQKENAEDRDAAKRRDNYASYTEGMLKPTEKKRLDYDRKYVLSPLTTVGNLPYRRLMKTLGTDITFCEMALSLPLVQGGRSEWALPRAHVSEVPNFGAQIAGSKPWHVIKATEALVNFAPDISEVNLNCGCPIDLLFRQGAGSALMENPARMLRLLKGMSMVSGDKPVTVKVRTGTKDYHNTAKSLVRRLVDEQQVAAITIHGRSRQQRYTKEADWNYIREVATEVKQLREDKEIKPWIIGNGDVYTWEDWHAHVDDQNVDTCMVARGALIKPWIFEEIESKQHLDKSASERLEYIKQYAHYGLEHWGSDQYGVEQTRRFLCEWLSFTYRYVPIGILEHMPPRLNDRPRPFQGRNELETLLASGNYRDWIKITEMFLGPCPDAFEFEPKHKSNAFVKESESSTTEPTVVS